MSKVYIAFEFFVVMVCSSAFGFYLAPGPNQNLEMALFEIFLVVINIVLEVVNLYQN